MIFAESGVSPNPCTEFYPGESSFSELESRALRDYYNSIFPKPIVAHALHSWGGGFHYPYSYKTGRGPKNWPEQVLKKVKGGKVQALKFRIFFRKLWWKKQWQQWQRFMDSNTKWSLSLKCVSVSDFNKCSIINPFLFRWTCWNGLRLVRLPRLAIFIRNWIQRRSVYSSKNSNHSNRRRNVGRVKDHSGWSQEDCNDRTKKRKSALHGFRLNDLSFLANAKRIRRYLVEYSNIVRKEARRQAGLLFSTQFQH